MCFLVILPIRIVGAHGLAVSGSWQEIFGQERVGRYLTQVHTQGPGCVRGCAERHVCCLPKGILVGRDVYSETYQDFISSPPTR